MNLDYLANIRPTRRQLDWQRMEMYAFLHFGMNTMTDREWGLGHEDPGMFNPTKVDVDQWMESLAAASMTGVILTCKHHDGFCLWPSAYTRHSVANSPWRNGKGDLVREVSEAARRHGLKFGVYLSPWDLTESTYGTGKPYNDFYVNQLIELLTHYGPIFSVWLDGANGQGPDGSIQHYDWQRIYNVVRALQPQAVISVCGPDVRWCGNEAGHARENEYSVVPERLRSAELTASKSQQVDDSRFTRFVRSDDDDLGSRSALSSYDGPLAWYPAEVNTSIRPGWFYHADEDDAARTPDELFDIWSSSVGGNATFLLNVPPNRHGLIADQDVAALKGLGERIRSHKARRIMHGVSLTGSSGKVDNDALLSDTYREAWQPEHDDTLRCLELSFPNVRCIDAVELREDVSQGQRVDEAVIEVSDERGSWREIARRNSIGFRRIIRFDAIRASGVRVSFPRLRQTVHLAALWATDALES